MKQVFTSINGSGRNSHLRYLNGNGIKFSKLLFLFSLAAFAIINSSFKVDLRQSSAEKVNGVKKAVPFKGELSVTLGEGGTSGTGVASHIGALQYVSLDVINFPFVTGTATITAANGDEIFTTFSGQLTDIGNGMLNVNIENTIIGGTGRFTGATGSFISTGTANAITGIANTTFTGTISY